MLGKADQILTKFKNYVELAPDQSLPDSPFVEGAGGVDTHAQSRTSGYYCCQQDMLKDGWKKVK